MGDLTVLYYTSNREEEAFEKKIRDALLAVVGEKLPIISVSQKPIELGTNICVGDVGACYANEYRQILIGAQAANTEWLIAAESDCLYPPAYFAYRPDHGNVWRYNNVWMLWRSPSYDLRFRRKKNSEGGQIVRRQFIIDRLTTVTRGLPEWHDPQHDWKVRVYGREEYELYGDSREPMISIKTGNGMRYSTQIMSWEEPQDELPFWGSADALRKELFEC